MALDFIPKIIYGTVPVTITFEYPPEKDPLNEELQSVGDEAISASGEEQFVQNFVREVLTLKFKYLSKTTLDLLRTFFINHASKGLSFSYYTHNTEVTYGTYTLNKKEFKPVRTSPDGSNDFRYEVTLEIRRVL